MNLEQMTDVYQPKKDGDLALLPCPFCGSDSIVYMSYDHAVGKRWAAVCMGCMAEVDPGWAQSKSAVQELWNKRS